LEILSVSWIRSPLVAIVKLMKLFVTARFKGDENIADIERLCRIARNAGFDDFCFIRDIEKYQRGVFSDSHELMARAREELLKCDALLIDVTDSPGGGRVIEAGIAFGHNKPVIIIAKRGTKVGVPMSGIAAVIIEYDEIDDIAAPLREFKHRAAQ
jgi:nucleoside 2-deoxyribosyltransferase